MSEFPEGAAIANGRWTITETLRGGPDRGMFRATGTCRALVTMGPPQRDDHDAVRMRLALAVPGVAPLLAITTAAGEGVPYDVLVEGEPEGAPVTARRPDDPRAVARGLAATVARAHAAGHVLGGIRPELVYAAGAAFTGVAPRAEPFLALAMERSYGVPPCFDEVYASPEALSLLPITAASDVFSLCATLVHVLEGTPPFAGANLLERMAAALRGMHRPTAVHPTIVAGLATSPAARPDAAAVLAALA